VLSVRLTFAEFGIKFGTKSQRSGSHSVGLAIWCSLVRAPRSSTRFSVRRAGPVHALHTPQSRVPAAYISQAGR
jgi:hypothetical protein